MSFKDNMTGIRDNNKMADINDRLNFSNLELNKTCENRFFVETAEKGTVCLDCSNEKRLPDVDQNSNEILKLGRKTTDIQQFYDGKNVFVTGATGFLGKILIEKLLRCCPGLENLYLLVRQKRGKDIYTRIDDIFEDPIFQRLKDEVPKFRHKIVAIPGDCSVAGLGITLTDRQILTEKVNIIFHSAATVKFDEHLRTALVTNVRAPLHVLRLARDLRRLDVVMHISTAYSNSHLSRIEEVFYPCPVDCDQLHALIDKLTDKEIDSILPTILGPWPNTYTFTKALAEKELRANCGTMPLGIFRPAIVTSTAKEPLPYWIDNMYGPTGVAVGSATGVLRTLQCDAAVSADVVPVDLVVNCLLAAARAVHHRRKRSTQPLEPPIFNYVSSVENRITWGEFMEGNRAYIDANPLSSAIWYFSMTLTRSALMHRVHTVLLHLAPAALADLLALALGDQPRMLKVYRKIHKFSSVISYFCTHDIQFCNKRTRMLWEETSEDDKKLFPFSMATMEWDPYFSGYLAGIRRYLFKEGDEDLPRARRKWRRLYYLHQIVRIIFAGLALYIIWSIFSVIF